ncbi:protein takeout [Halyomorpha halys]|uniref:protein takeout n=1 Tax=Halyomorpha halys TaxID=286706 RepID=UPI0006D4EABB|nr:protein takeout-like [Halyomorpha halys]
MVSVNIIIFLFCVAGTHSALPEGWSACKHSSPGYEECLKQQINNAILFLKNGNSKMSMIPLEPLRFETMVIEQGSGPVSVTMKMHHVLLQGLSDSKVTSVKNDWKKMFIKFHTPHSGTAGDYIGKGQVLQLKLNGTGKFSLDYENLDYSFDINFKQITKDGKKYFQVDKMSVGISPQKVVIYVENLFSDNKEMGDNMNKFLNENWRVIIEEMKPTISRKLGEVYSQYINRILSQIPAQEIDVK